MKSKLKLTILAALLMFVAVSAGYAESESGNAIVNVMGQILRMPFTMLHKAGDSLQDSKATTSSEDVAVSDVYNLDAETTG